MNISKTQDQSRESLGPLAACTSEEGISQKVQFICVIEVLSLGDKINMELW